MATFDVNAALNAGYSKKDILDHVEQAGNIFNVTAARNAGYSDNEIAKEIEKQHINAISKTQDQPQSETQQVLGGLASAPINAYLGAKQLITGISPTEQKILQYNRKAESQAPVSSALSNIATMAIPGTALARGAEGAGLLANALRTVGRGMSLPTTATEAAAGGAAYGALQPTQQGESRALNTALGGTSGLLGYGIGAGISRAVKPIRFNVAERGRLAQAASAEGIPLTAAEVTGSKPLQNIHAALSNLPGTAGREAAVKEQTQTAFNRAVLKRAGINAEKATPDVLNQRFKELGDVYNRLSSGKNVTFGDKLLNALSEIDAAQTDVRGVMPTAKIDRLVNGMFEKMQKGTISGESAQTIRSELTKEIKSAASSGNVRLSDALKTLRNGIDESIRGGLSKADINAWDKANRQYANLKVIENVMGRPSAGVSEGDISGRTLASALKQSNRGQSYARGRGDLNVLSRIGKLFVQEPVNDSGTAQRLLYERLLRTGGLGIGAGGLGASAATGDPRYAEYAALGGIGGLALPKIIQSGIRSPAMQDYLIRGIGSNRAQILADQLRRIGGPALTAGALGVSQ